MTEAVFPTLPGLAWSVFKKPSFAVRKQTAISGRELRLLDQTKPIWEWTLTYSFLRDRNDTRGAGGLGDGYDELRTLCGFWLQRNGSFQSFLYDDPTDNSVTNQLLGVGTGSATVFQLLRSFGGFTEDITAPNVVAAIRDNGLTVAPANYTVNTATGLVTFTAAPLAGHVIAADFTYRHRVRFSEDEAEFENFMFQLWSMRQLKFRSDLL